ncbi:MAG: HD domain-containing phosphohydrolase [Solirubrobacteraceae bacterium]
MLTRLLKLALLGALALYAVIAVAQPLGVTRESVWVDLLHNGLMVSAALVCFVRAGRLREDRLAWCFAGLALTLYAAGELTWSIHFQDQADPPVPSLADVFWLAYYPTIYVTLVLLVRSRVSRLHWSLWFDGLAGALAIAAVGAALVSQPVLDATGGSPAAVATTVAYPLADLLLIGIVVGMFGLTGWRPGRAWTLLGAALATNAVADTFYSYETARGTWVDGSFADVLFPASALLLAAAAWQPVEDRRTLDLRGRRLIVVPVIFVALAFGVTVYAYVGGLNPLAAFLAMSAMLVVVLRTVSLFMDNARLVERSHGDARTDALTGLGNRRGLLEDLDEQLAQATPTEPRALALFDLNGFKRYNDAFGHPAGDALLARLGGNLGAMALPYGSAYRLGGDEFCLLLHDTSLGVEALMTAAVEVLTEEGEGFAVSASHGVALLPIEARSAAAAMQLADQRMYACKGGRAEPPGRQARNALLGVLQEREPELHEHTTEVARLALAIGTRLGMSAEELDELARAAELHDIGKMAIPDAILSKPGPLDAAETDFMRSHTIIGERVLATAPALRPVVRLVRSSHERVDGRGYPDGLAGDEIPFGARIISVCDAFAAMMAERPDRPAMDRMDALLELQRNKGSQFDARVVDAFFEEEARLVLPAAKLELDI